MTQHNILPYEINILLEKATCRGATTSLERYYLVAKLRREQLHDYYQRSDTDAYRITDAPTTADKPPV